MRHQLFFLLLPLFSILFLQCGSEEQAGCLPMGQFTRIPLDSAKYRGLSFSPFQKDRIWAFVPGLPQSIVEIDLISATSSRRIDCAAYDFVGLDFKIDQRLIKKDPYDSLIWHINGTPSYFDFRTEEIHCFQRSQVDVCVFLKDRVLFVEKDTMFSWNRTTKVLTGVVGFDDLYLGHKVFGEDSIIIHNHWVYDCRKNTLKKISHAANDNTYRREQYANHYGDVKIYEENTNQSFSYTYRKDTTQIQVPIEKQITVYDGVIWGLDHENNLIAWNPKNRKKEIYPIEAPYTGGVIIDKFWVDNQYIWINSRYFYLIIDKKTKRTFSYPITNEPKLVQILSDDCHVFLLTNKYIDCFSRDSFIKSCAPLDNQKFDRELAEMKDYVDSTGLKKDSTLEGALDLLAFIKDKYKNSQHLGIGFYLDTLVNETYSQVLRNKPPGWKSSYKNTELPLEFRKMVLYSQFYGLCLEKKYREAAVLASDDFRYFPNDSAIPDNGHPRTDGQLVIDFVREIDSIGKNMFSDDSLFYFKARAWASIDELSMNCSQTCAGCNYSNMYGLLRDFVNKFPQSLLKDNAAFSLELYAIHPDYMNDTDYWIYKKDLLKFLRKYPETDLRPMIEEWIYENPHIETNDEAASKKFIEEGKSFLKQQDEPYLIAELKKVINKLEE